MKKFLSLILILITIATAIVTILSRQAAIVSPVEQEWLPFLGLAILPLVVVNLCFFLLWCICKSRWALLPFAMLLMHWEFIISMFQVRIFPDRLPEEKTKIKVISYNVDNFQSGQKDQLPAILEWIHQENPDIVCIQESSAKWVIPADSLAKVFADFPYQTFSEKSGADTNMTLLSKFPILESQAFLYPQSGNQSYLAVLDIQGKRVKVLNNHLQTTSVNTVKPRLYKAIKDEDKKEEASAFKEMTKGMKRNFKMRASQVDSMRLVMDKVSGPMIVCGDFNDPPMTYTYRKMKGELTDGFRDCGSGFGYTFRQIKRMFRIDYIFYSSHFKGLKYDSPNLDFSDHKPVVWEGYLK